MANVILHPGWHLSGDRITSEAVFHNRRRFLSQIGLAGAGLLSSGALLSRAADSPPAGAAGYPAARHPDFNPDWRMTNERVASRYNNFYEFTLSKDVHTRVDGFVTSPWPISISGLVEKPMTLDAAELGALFGLEERIYRFRCVEAWAMIVPWTGFPLRKLIEKVVPKPTARFLRFETFNRPDQAPGMKEVPNYPWPYFEGLRLDEALNPLTLVATGIYGKPLPKQHGAPVRLVVPWKYGYKSIKSIVKIDFTETQPKTFWETLQPDEYPFESNVDPHIPHPRWSQATERMIDSGDRVKTQPYNGYARYVAELYAKR